MRTLSIILSVGLLITLFQYSNGNPMKSVASSSEEDDSVESKTVDEVKTISSESDESDEIKTAVKSSFLETNEKNEDAELSKALEFLRKVQESESHSNEDNTDDQFDEILVADNNEQKIVEESDED
ncbi:hypothetical protein I4U23_009273 [Adineta vaga]|nr:hypothetical protein I4U23_009273 [Adineta vaga]